MASSFPPSETPGAPDASARPDQPTPGHVAIIMDGNGRWAKARGLSRSEGHRAGVEVARRIVEDALDFGLTHLTLYTFSRENWNRPAEEVRFLFELLVDFITKELPVLEKRGVQLRILGEVSDLPFAARKTLSHACSRTSRNNRMILNLALNYSGREEIARACRRYLEGGGRPDALSPESLEPFLYTAGQPDPDLVIRTSGEMRVSNFLLFQTAYSEFYFTKTLWPDFTAGELRAAITDYMTRSRRFGGVDEAD